MATKDERLQAIHDLATSRLFNLDSAGDPNVTHDLTEIARLSAPEKDERVECKNCPFYKHVHYEEGGKLVAPGCTGFEENVTRTRDEPNYPENGGQEGSIK